MENKVGCKLEFYDDFIDEVKRNRIPFVMYERDYEINPIEPVVEKSLVGTEVSILTIGGKRYKIEPYEEK